jgi:hypothetical protein
MELIRALGQQPAYAGRSPSFVIPSFVIYFLRRPPPGGFEDGAAELSGRAKHDDLHG